MGSLDDEVTDCFDCEQTSFIDLMTELSSLNGYRAAAILTDTGELLYSNTASRENACNLDQLVKDLNAFFMDTHEIAEKAGFINCSELSLRTDREVVAIHCSGKDCLVGIRIFTMVEAESNVSFIQRQLRSLLPRILKCLTWDPDNLVPLYMREMKNRTAPPASLTERLAGMLWDDHVAVSNTLRVSKTRRSN